jgi:hypothetical protein
MRKSKPKPILLCECGCGEYANGGRRFISGHNAERSDKVSEKCECGCGKWASPGKRFIVGHNAIGNKNALGIKRSDETRLKLRISHLGQRHSHSDETKQRIGKKLKGNQNSKGFRHSKKSKERMSETTSRRIASGEINPGKAPFGYHVSFVTGRKEFWRGSYEQCRMSFLDSQGIYWTKSHHFRIPYIDVENVKRNYVPDFLVWDSETNQLWVEEVKGWIVEADICKWRSAILYFARYGIPFRVLLCNDLEVTELPNLSLHMITEGLIRVTKTIRNIFDAS